MPRAKRPGGLPSKKEIAEYLNTAEGAATRRDIARAFNIKGEDRAKLRSLLKELEAEGGVKRAGAKKFHLADALPPVLPVDIMSVDDDGDLLCLPSKWEGETEPPIIKLTLREAGKHKPPPGVGDRILARLIPAGDDSYEAKIIRAIGKGAHRFLAVFRERKFGGLAEPVERRARTKFTIDRANAKGAKEGDLVWVEAGPQVGRSGATERGRVREIAGHVDDKNAYSLIALAGHDVPIDLPADVLAEAEKAKLPPLGDRVDLRDVPLVTIDPEDAKDHDDAVWAAPDESDENQGGFKVIVAIADVSWFVRPETKLDREARARANSVYLPDRVVPMLPERLSNNLCSLRVNEDRPCIAVEMILDRDGRKRSHRFMRAMMRSAAKLSYGDAQDLILDRKKKGPIANTVHCLNDAFRARWKERSKRAPLDLDLPERKIILDENGNVAAVIRRERFDAHRLIEEFMILANVAAAEELERHRRVQIYRVHDTPSTDKLDSIREYLAELDYSLLKSGAVRPSHFNQLLKIAEARDQKEMISDVVLRAQSQAVYSTENLGHFGLNLPRYSHFTSPIRRYADLTIHRALVSACKLGEGGQTPEEAAQLPKIAEAISDLERRAIAVEREANDRYLAGYLETRIGEEFNGRIRGVTRFGLFVMLDDSGADGFVPMRTLGPERYDFIEERHAVVGQQMGGVYRLGQHVRVALAEAAPLSGGLRFEMLSDPIEDPDFKPGERKPRFEKRYGKKGRRTKPARGTTSAKTKNKGKPSGKPGGKPKKRTKANAKPRRN